MEIRKFWAYIQWCELEILVEAQERELERWAEAQERIPSDKQVNWLKEGF